MMNYIERTLASLWAKFQGEKPKRGGKRKNDTLLSPIMDNSDYETVVIYANDWVLSHIEQLVDRGRPVASRQIVVPDDWSVSLRVILYEVLNRNGLSVIEDVLIDFDEDGEDIRGDVVYWPNSSTPPDTFLGKLWLHILTDGKKGYRAKRHEALTFLEVIKPKLALGEAVFVTAPLWGAYGYHIADTLRDMNARIFYNAARESYVIALRHKASWADLPLYDDDIVGPTKDDEDDDWIAVDNL